MALFKTIDDIRDYVNIPATMEIDRLTPLMEPSALKNIKPVLGKELLELLDTYYNDVAPDPDAALDALLPKVQAALAHFILFDGIALLDVVVTSTGFGVVHTNNIAPASKERVAAYKQSIEDMGYEAIEELYEFLEENEADYEEWTTSTAYSKHFELFLNSALQFEDYVIIKKSRRAFLDLVPAMKRVEMFEIVPKISEALEATIKAEIKADTVSDENAKALNLIRGALANLAKAESIQVKVDGPAYTQPSMIANAKAEKEGFERAGIKYLGELRRLLDENVSDYPDYQNSDIYDDERETYDLYENEEDDSIFVM